MPSKIETLIELLEEYNLITDCGNVYDDKDYITGHWFKFVPEAEILELTTHDEFLNKW